MSMEKTTSFKSDADIRSFFKDIKARSFKPRYKVQHLKLGTRNLGEYDYTTITAEWFKWYHRRKNGEDNMFHIVQPPIYFVEGLPFGSPHFKRFFFKGPASLLVPIYSFSASRQEYPSFKEESELLEL
jgi:hypothetical protein